jgi:cell division protein FtsI/penicillin-binding protein 2
MSNVISAPSPSDRARQRNRLHRDIIHKRVRIGFVLLLIGYLALACRLVYIQGFRHHYFQAVADSIEEHKILLPAQRGNILDRNGVPLAVNVDVGDIVADPTAIDDPSATGRALADVVSGLDAGQVQQAITAAQHKRTPKGVPVRFLILAKSLPYVEVEAFQAKMRDEQKAHFTNAKTTVDLGGLTVHLRQTRQYPNGDLAAQVLGFVNQGKAGDTSTSDVAGKYGVEASMNAALCGRDGSLLADTDAQGRVIPGAVESRTAPVNGADVRLTIDSNIQRIAQDELEKSWAIHHAAIGTVIVLDPRNGDILAMASLPTFDPNHIKGTTNMQWHNPAVTDLYEPGSTLKTLTLSAVMDAKGLQHQYDRVVCTGTMRVGNHIIHCAKDPPLFGVHGVETMRDVLKNSCNIGAAQYALGLGAPTLFEYEQRFGLLERPNSGLPDEEFCHLKGPDAKPWSKIELANIAFGQGISMTPLQLAGIYATVANNGVRVHPHIVLGQDYTGPPERAIKPAVAQTMLSMLQTVVTDGTGKPAQIAGYNVGGKTGSAQVAEHGHYGDQYVGSFCGIVPLSHPRLVILCAIFKPQGVHWGAVVAAPVVHNIAKEAMLYLKDPPDNPAMADWDDAHKQQPSLKAASVPRHRRAKSA